jgi:hypothetical protein
MARDMPHDTWYGMQHAMCAPATIDASAMYTHRPSADTAYRVATPQQRKNSFSFVTKGFCKQSQF